MSFNEKILEKTSNSYIFYKNNYYKLKEREKELKNELRTKDKELSKKKDDLSNVKKQLKEKQELVKKKHEELLSRIDDYYKLKGDYTKLYWREEWLTRRYQKDYLYFDVDSLFSKFYVNPFLKYPFEYQAKWGLELMDHLAKYLEYVADCEDEPLISIIYPIHNYEEHILDSISSVLNQTYKNFELLVIDDGSEDNTLNLLKSVKDERITVLSNEEPKGLSYCRNIALNQAKGEYIFYLDMNHSWQKRYLKAMVGAFSKLSADAIYSGYYLYDDNENNLLGMMYGVYNKALLYNKNYISLSAFAHKSCLKDDLQFDESLDSLEDWHFIACFSKNFKMYSVPILQSIYHYNKELENLIVSFDDENYEDDQIKLVHDKIGTDMADFSNRYELNKKISIIIPSYEILDDLKESIDTILSFNLDLVDIIVVDNNSNENVRNYLEYLYDEGKIKYIQNDVNYGFTYAIEQGISIADDGSDILIFNNDAILTKGALEAMQYHAYEIDDCGIVVPQQFLYGGDDRINDSSPFPDSRFEYDVTPSMAHQNIINVPIFHDGETLELSFAPFFCAYVKREVYDQSLGLDAELGRHYDSDRIFSDFVRHVQKLKIYHVSDAKVYHKTQQSTKILEEKEDEYDMIFLKNKWEDGLAKELGYENSIWKQ